MKKRIMALVSASALALASCSDGPADLVGSQATNSESAKTVRLDGLWTQKNSNSDDGWMEATIEGENIQVDWVFENGADRFIYWVGTFNSEVDKKGETSFESVRDDIAMSSALLSASAETKEFTHNKGILKFEMSMQDLTTEVEMERSGDLSEDDKISGTSDAYNFAGGVLTTPNLTIAITDHRIIPVGEEGNEYGEKPVIAFFYDVTNNGKELIDPMVWIDHFSAVQDNDPNFVNELQVASHPDPETLDTQLVDIKPGGTVSNAVAYELSDESTPVELTAEAGVFGGEIGRQEFRVE